MAELEVYGYWLDGESALENWFMAIMIHSNNNHGCEALLQIFKRVRWGGTKPLTNLTSVVSRTMSQPWNIVTFTHLSHPSKWTRQGSWYPAWEHSKDASRRSLIWEWGHRTRAHANTNHHFGIPTGCWRWTCPICHEPFTSSATVQLCGHEFDITCPETWWKQIPRELQYCPRCGRDKMNVYPRLISGGEGIPAPSN